MNLVDLSEIPKAYLGLKLIPNQWYSITQKAQHIALEAVSINSQETTLIFFSEHGLEQFEAQLEPIFNQLQSKVKSLCTFQPSPQLAMAYALQFALSVSDVKAMINAFSLPKGLAFGVIQNAPDLKTPGLLVMDMDSTAIEIECIDEIARLAGVYDEVSAVTAQAMQGSLAFSDSLTLRVAKLQGVELELIESLKEKLPLMDGVKALCQALKAAGWHLAIASGGFVPFAKKVQSLLGLDAIHANHLVDDGKVLTGEVRGVIVDAKEKARFLSDYAQSLGVPLSQTVAMGDGANDLVMMAKSGLGVSVHGKPKVVEQADVAINTGSLLQLLYFISLPQ